MIPLGCLGDGAVVSPPTKKKPTGFAVPIGSGAPVNARHFAKLVGAKKSNFTMVFVGDIW